MQDDIQVGVLADREEGTVRSEGLLSTWDRQGSVISFHSWILVALMITYGTKRKKKAKPVSFSSDESDDEDSVGNRSGSSLPFALSPRKSPSSKVILNNSPNKRINIQELAANDPLTKSPKRFMRTIDSMQSERLPGSAGSRGRNDGHGSSFSSSPSRSPSPTPMPRRNLKTYQGSKSAGPVSKLSQEAGPQQGRLEQVGAKVGATETRDSSKMVTGLDPKPRRTGVISKESSTSGPKSGLKDESAAWNTLFSSLSNNKAVADKKPAAKRNLSSKSPSAWDDLFSNLKESNVEKLDIITKLSKDLVRWKDDTVADGGDSSDSDFEADTTVSSYLLEGIQTFSAPATRQESSPPFSFSKSSSMLNETNPSHKLATYGNVRSFLDGDGDKNQAMDEHAADLDAEPSSKDLNDLKSLGKMQMETEEMEYLFDSLVFIIPPSSSSSIESCNQVLINFLVDLCMDIWNSQEVTIAWKGKSSGLLKHLSKRVCQTWKELATSMNQMNGKLVESLIVILIYGISITEGENIDLNEPFLGQKLMMMGSSSISISIESYTLSSQTIQNIKQLAPIINSANILDKSKIVGLLAKEVCEKSKNPDFQFFKSLAKFINGRDIQLASGLVWGCNNISNIFELINDDDECLETIIKFLEWGELKDDTDIEENKELRLKVLEILVVLSTKIDIDSKELLGVIMGYQTRVVKTVLVPNLSNLDDKISGDLAILAMGYLLNIVEFSNAQGIQIEFLPYIQDIFLKLPKEPSNDIEIHINGYFALIVAILKVDLFDRELIIDHLTKFQREISTIGRNKIYEKISLELKLLLDDK
ncbi:hypothetical protein CLIB1423_06S03774 [[Candida] railenensis]|uniref:Uncharacterized protein n=1 Tax=[Candida] railenensis TaxID=45579 RepID=A0A9P0QPX2_9ASCO|nr:hypothetical protein CLIB1423_06S03774 [[Candida] railenensis]